jgi:hypothetical protein
MAKISRASSGEPHAEKDLMDEALKWQVVKSFHRRMTGLGPSSNWKLAVDYLPLSLCDRSGAAHHARRRGHRDNTKPPASQ